jgi:hypothetical protein
MILPGKKKAAIMPVRRHAGSLHFSGLWAQIVPGPAGGARGDESRYESRG